MCYHFNEGEKMSILFESGKIGNLKLKNRFIRSGTWTALASEDGYVTEDLLSYYKKLAAGNLGMVVVGYARILEDERANNNMLALYDDKFIPGLRKLTQMFHEHGSMVGIQLAIGGTQIHYKGDVKWKIYAPSARKLETRVDSFGNELAYHANEMSKQEIEFIIEKYAKAAKRVKDSGFDMVQIHAGHGYFASQWMNPQLNQRTDEYGLDRSKFIVDLYKAIRANVGDDFTVAIKINSEENIGDFSNHQAMLQLCQKLDQLGIDLIEVSGAFPSRNKIKTTAEESYFATFAGLLSKSVNCATMLTGGNKTFNNIEYTLKDSGVDFIGLSRTLVSESNLIDKWQQDEQYQPRCISCNHCHRVVNTCVFDKK